VLANSQDIKKRSKKEIKKAIVQEIEDNFITPKKSE